MNERPWLRAEGVFFRHPGTRQDALCDVDLSLQANTIGVIGRNGSGKSTLLSLLSGRRRTTRGGLSLDGIPAHDRRLAERRSFASQRSELDPDMSVDEHCELFGRLHRVPHEELEARSSELLQRMSLHELGKRRASTLSGGQRRRLHLVLSLLAAPELWLADEPDNGLDAEGRQVLWQLLNERTQAGLHSVLALHDLSAVATHTQQVVGMARGRVVLCELREDLGSDAVAALEHLSRFVSQPPPPLELSHG